MPLIIKESLSALKKLEDEDVFVIGESRAVHQDIRALRIAIVNIMPDKQQTELQLLRLLSNSPLQVEVTFIKLVTHKYKNVSKEYLDKNYVSFDEIKEKKFDGLIITGAPVENLKYEEVDYWKELTQIMDWSKTNVTSTLHLCWAAQASLYYHYGINKYKYQSKLSGIFLHHKSGNDPITRGFDDSFYAPHSRYTGVKTESINSVRQLHINAWSEEAGAYIITSESGERIFVNGHPEYDLFTLDNEYKRDYARGLNPNIPKNYYKDSGNINEPVLRWSAHSHLLFSNWLNYCVYQRTPFDENKIGKK